ncbi:PREDICTED: uncharacterized protein LOC109582657 [Amphimedon queenslandica]|uniref:G-protein coupled receptors family 2 profile 2 domain-containing protein n=1 Tax=Amphimedon queenslandica TaxID=400682 RepID=A0A1X7VSP5_AMPQE|nr:PREDICTED: uncharacterized protein LOC109582657 [Amphimedon queenslandica]|eukprot:XP_019853059.1 PREDICTED: uncharacterized protein LOC109582657 [Amphimedon queenslandica]
MEELDEENATTNHTHSGLLSSEQKYIILLTMCVLSIISIIICLIAMVMAVKFKLHKYFVHRLAIYQVLSAMLYDAVLALEVVFINYDTKKSVYYPVCVVEAFLIEYSIWIKLLFTFCLTFHLFCFSVFHVNLNRLEIVYILVSTLGPALFTWVPFVNGLYGLAGAWCWIQNWKGDNALKKLPQGEIEQYTLLYGPAIFCLLLCGVAVVIVTAILVHRAYNCNCCNNKIHDDDDNENQPLLKEQLTEQKKKVLREMLPLVSYPILSLMFYIPAFINRLVGSISQSPNFISFMWSGVSLPLIGLLAGVSLIVHIFILEHPKRRSTIKKRRQLVDVTQRIKSINDVFTTDTVASTAAKTHFEVPPESAIDEELNPSMN